MSNQTDHTITLHVVAGFDGLDWWRSRCTCGYRSGRHGSAGQAESAGREHARAKNGATR